MPFIMVGVPVGIVGAILLNELNEYEELLRGSYALLMLLLSFELIRHHDPVQELPLEPEGESVGATVVRPTRTIVGRDGVEYSFKAPR